MTSVEIGFDFLRVQLKQSLLFLPGELMARAVGLLQETLALVLILSKDLLRQRAMQSKRHEIGSPLDLDVRQITA